MNALVLNRPGEFSYEERPYPKCGPQDVVVKIGAVCICGSDNHAIKGDKTSFAFPLVIGHEVAGMVVETGREVSSLAVGDQVCLMPCISCDICRACQRGRTNACRELKLYGVHCDGGLQEYLSTPEKYWIKVPFEAKMEELSMLEPLTIGAHAVTKLDLRPGDRVLVIGAGPIGMSCAVNAQTYGAEVALVETNEARRIFGKERFPYPIFSPLSDSYGAELDEFTQGEGFDAVVDTTAVKASMDHAWQYLTQGGRLVFVGICSGTLEIDGRPFHMKEPSLFTTRNSTPQDYARIIQQWQQKKIDPSMFVTHTVPFDKAGNVLVKWTNNPESVFKGTVLF